MTAEADMLPGNTAANQHPLGTQIHISIASRQGGQMAVPRTFARCAKEGIKKKQKKKTAPHASGDPPCRWSARLRRPVVH